jgi:hypothetical protein
MKQNLFEITQEEKKRIIYLHERRTSQHYLTEQITTVETQTMIACGTGDLQQVKTLNGQSVMVNDDVAHTICDNLKKKYPYEYGINSPNHADSRSAASSRKVQQTGGKKVKETVESINYKKFQGFCDTKGLMSEFKTWLLTNNPKGLEQLKITDKTTVCDTKYYQLWYATLNPAQKVGDKTFVYLGELFKYYNDFAKTGQEALKSPDITAKKDSIKSTSTKHGVEINGQLYEVDGETGKANMVKLANEAEGSTDIEDWVNLISFALEFIPGFGTGASAIVDNVQALVSLIKSHFATDTFDKAVHLLKGSVGLGVAEMSGVGNVINAEIKLALKWLSNWWKQLLAKLPSLLEKGKITKALAEELKSGKFTTVFGTLFAMLTKTIANFGKDILENYFKTGIAWCVGLLNDYKNIPGVQNLIDMLNTFAAPIETVINFLNSFGEEIKKLPTNLSQV